MDKTVDVLILDEQQGWGAAVRAALEHMPKFHTIDEADLEGADIDTTVALIFIDEIRLVDGIDRLVSLKERQPNLRALVAFRALIADDLRALLAAGADAFVVRSRSPRDVAAALLALAQGSNCLVAPEQSTPMPADNPRLTPREAEVLRFVISGFSNREIAQRLAVNLRTIENHRLNLRRKTQTGGLSDLISLARHLGLPPVVKSDAQHGV